MHLWRTSIVSTLLLMTVSVMAEELTEMQLLELQRQLTEELKKSVTQNEAQERLAALDLYQKNNPIQPFMRGIQGALYESPQALSKATASTDASSVKRILVLANKTLYANVTAKEKIDRYIQDIRAAHGCTVILETLQGGTPPEIKEIIKGHYKSGGLDGVVQIGKLPEAWYESDNDPTTGKYDKFTCDLYYMDLDGSWTDANKNGLFDGHTKGSGTLGIEVFYGRIDCTTMGTYGNEITLLSAYMDKLHNYYLGGVPLNKAALGYLDYDWKSSANYINQIFPGSSQNELIRWTESNPPVNKSDYVTKRLQKNYSALHMWCHAGHNAHYHHTGGSTSTADVYNANPKPVAYFHDGCHVSDFAAGNGRSFLGGAYVFNKSPASLLCLSGSRSGQWLGLMARVMFQELAKNTSVGQAFKIWFTPYQNTSEERDKQNFIGWNYGYNIFGDPLITLVSRDKVHAVQEANAALNLKKPGITFNNKTLTITHLLTQTSNVSVNIYDMSGKRVHHIYNTNQPAGLQSLTLDTKVLPTGSYIVSFRNGKDTMTERVSIQN